MSDIFYLTIGMVVGMVIFWLGLLCGMLMYRSGHTSGVKLVDRIRHDQTPFDDEMVEREIQLTTGGDFEKIE